METKETKVKPGLLKVIEIANSHPDELNEEGLRSLMSDVSEELPIEEVDKLLKGYGYVW